MPKSFPLSRSRLSALVCFESKKSHLGLIILITSISTKFLVNQTYLIDIKDLFYIVAPNSVLTWNNLLYKDYGNEAKKN